MYIRARRVYIILWNCSRKCCEHLRCLDGGTLYYGQCIYIYRYVLVYTHENEGEKQLRHWSRRRQASEMAKERKSQTAITLLSANPIKVLQDLSLVLLSACRCHILTCTRIYHRYIYSYCQHQTIMFFFFTLY